MGIYVALHLKRIIMSVATSHDQGASPDHSEQKRIKGLGKAHYTRSERGAFDRA